MTNANVSQNVQVNWLQGLKSDRDGYSQLLQHDLNRKGDGKTDRFWERYGKAAKNRTNWQSLLISIMIGLFMAALIIVSHYNVKPYIRIVASIGGFKNVSLWGWLLYLAFQLTQLGTTILLGSEALIYKLAIVVSVLPKVNGLDEAVYGKALTETHKRVANRYVNLIAHANAIRTVSYIIDTIFVIWHTPFLRQGVALSTVISTGAWSMINWWALLSIPATVAGVELLFWVIRRYTDMGKVFMVSIDDLASVTNTQTATATATKSKTVRLPKTPTSKKRN